MSRRSADEAIAAGRVHVDNVPARPGQDVNQTNHVLLNGKSIVLTAKAPLTIMLNKPVGYVCSRDGQGSKTVYALLPPPYHTLKPVGRLDKDSSGLLLLTSDGQLAQRLTHPSFQKTKVYEVTLDKPLKPADWEIINNQGVTLADGPSRLELKELRKNDRFQWLVTMREGRNRQIRRTFAARSYRIAKLHRTHFGSYRLGSLPAGQWRALVD